jgi:hypothetical protein
MRKIIFYTAIPVLIFNVVLCIVRVIRDSEKLKTFQENIVNPTAWVLVVITVLVLLIFDNKKEEEA